MLRVPALGVAVLRRMIGPPLAAAAVLAAGLLAPVAATAAEDPLEPFNRAMFDFNRALVLKVVDPTVDTVGPYVPTAVRTSLHNAYANLTEIEFIINGALRRDLGGTMVPTGRFVVNSTLGVAGLFDVATPMGLERRESDFIESVCQIGLPPGDYVVLPVVGPASLNYAVLIASGAAIQLYAFSYVSPALVVFDVVTDLGVAAGGLRYADTAAQAGGGDPYETLRRDHMDYVERGCATAPPPPPIPFRRKAATNPATALPRALIERVTP